MADFGNSSSEEMDLMRMISEYDGRGEQLECIIRVINHIAREEVSSMIIHSTDISTTNSWSTTPTALWRSVNGPKTAADCADLGDF
jgi:hypothetical protein